MKLFLFKSLQIVITVLESDRTFVFYFVVLLSICNFIIVCLFRFCVNNSFFETNLENCLVFVLFFHFYFLSHRRVFHL